MSLAYLRKKSTLLNSYSAGPAIKIQNSTHLSSHLKERTPGRFLGSLRQPRKFINSQRGGDPALSSSQGSLRLRRTQQLPPRFPFSTCREQFPLRTEAGLRPPHTSVRWSLTLLVAQSPDRLMATANLSFTSALSLSIGFCFWEKTGSADVLRRWR